MICKKVYAQICKCIGFQIKCKIYILGFIIKTHGSESRGQGGSTLRRPSRRTHVSILQEQTLLK